MRLKKILSALILGGSPMSALAVPAHLEVISIQDAPSSPSSMSLLFLGYQENNHHSPTAVFSALSPTFLTEGIQATFTSSLNSLSADNLANYDALMISGNVNSSGAGSSNQPLVPIIQHYVENGGALIGLHVASAAFRNDLRFGALLGGRFQSHTTGSFTPENIKPDHALIKGLTPLTSFDETYILKDLNPHLHVLQERVTSSGTRFAWTWTRSEGHGRVFYTASGHVPAGGDTSLYDSITKSEFSELVLRGLHWGTRRHFSGFSGVSLGSDHAIWGEGLHRATELQCLWQDTGTGPILSMVQGDPITIGTETFDIGPLEPNTTIPCSDTANSVISSRTILDQSGQVFRGLWKLTATASPQSLVLTGQTFPSPGSPELVESLGQTIGTDFVANTRGNSLFRARLKDPTTLEERSIIATGNQGIILSEGDLTPGLPAALTIGNLDRGSLTLNHQGNFSCGITLSDTSKALAVSDNGTLSILAIEGQAVPGLPNIQWGTSQYLSLNSANQLFFVTSLIGEVVESNDSALVRYSLADQQLSIVLREGDGILGTSFVGDLSAAEFAVDRNSHCHLFIEINGPLVSTANDQVLISMGEESKVIAREGDSLPTFASGSSIGSELGNTPLISDETGTLYFVANVIREGNSHSQLFQAIDTTIFGVIGGGDVISNGTGTSFELSAIIPFERAGLENGLPSPIRDDKLAIAAQTTGGHQILLRLGDLLDLDQDGFPNVLEAGIGADPLDPSVNRQLFPKIELKNGENYYTFLRATGSGLPLPTLEESTNLESWHLSNSPVELWDDQTQVPNGFEKLSTPLNRLGIASQFLRLAF